MHNVIDAHHKYEKLFHFCKIIYNTKQDKNALALGWKFIYSTLAREIKY